MRLHLVPQPTVPTGRVHSPQLAMLSVRPAMRPFVTHGCLKPLAQGKRLDSMETLCCLSAPSILTCSQTFNN
eukprot:2996252-Amphidinium_carterae.1